MNFNALIYRLVALLRAWTLLRQSLVVRSHLLVVWSISRDGNFYFRRQRTGFCVDTFASIPAVAVVLGGMVAAFRTPSPAMRSGVQHVAAGALFAALATELLPDVLHRRLPWVTLIGFALGVAAMCSSKPPRQNWRRQPVVSRSKGCP